MYEVLEFFLHVDKYIATIADQYGALVYALLFTIVFVETGIVVIPFLPGDSLLFAAGALAAIGVLGFPELLILFFTAAVLGDIVNYWVGAKMGYRLLQKIPTRFFNPEHIKKGEKFYQDYGSYAIVSGRFIPIVRTVVSFVAGLAHMHYGTFLIYNVVGAAIWVGGLVTAGYLFGNLPIIQNNFGLVTLGIIALSLLPPVLEYWRIKRNKAEQLD